MIPKFFDIHGHPNFAAFDADRGEAVERALKAGVAMVAVGTQKDTSRAAVDLAEKYDLPALRSARQASGVYACVGLHPIHTGRSFHDKEELGIGGAAFTSRGEEFDYAFYKTLASNPKVVGIGECGLDYYHSKNQISKIKIEDGAIEKQEEAFRKQIELAIEVGKPLMLHLRNPSASSGLAGSGRSAYKDAHKILATYDLKLTTGNLHFFAGSIDEAKPFLDLGFSFSFTGVITFARSYDEIIRYLPLERIMSETDCPYVAPAPFRGKRNEPLYVREVVKAIAEIRGADFEKVRAALLENAQRFFRLSFS